MLLPLLAMALAAAALLGPDAAAPGQIGTASYKGGATK